MSHRVHSYLEPLESRIAPATVIHPLPDIVAGPGQASAIVDLSKIIDESGTYPNRTLVTIHTNFDADPLTDGIQGDITFELFDDLAPLTVQNFLRYALNPNANGDYDNTFFHRVVPGFVLQGGGFQVANGKTVEHIDTFPAVHNEFDPSRSNLRGTLALAKTSVSPNTGTSEWFINLEDNTSLDSNNGGFTVFGRIIDKPGVIDGMEVVDKIVAARTVSGVISGFDTPVQGYDPDPDNNPQTPAPALKPEHLITITDVTVERSSGTKPAGVSYTVDSVTTVQGDSNLLTTSINGADLSVKYAPGKTGIAEVKVKITVEAEDGSTSDTYETFRVTVQPNLVTSFASNSLWNALVPGDTSKVKLNLTNTGGGLAKGDVDVHFYFAQAVWDQANQIYRPGARAEWLDANSVTHSVNIASGKTATLNAEVRVPSELVSDQSVQYLLVAEVVPRSDNFNSPELQSSTGVPYTDDNLAADHSHLHQIFNAFGNVGSRKNLPLEYTDANGDTIRFTIKGGGYGQLFKNDDGTVDLLINGTTAKTQIAATYLNASSPGADGEISFQNIEARSTVGSVNFGIIDVSGNIAFSSGVKSLQLEDITGPSTMSIGLIPGSEKAKTSLTFGKIEELALESTMPIASLKAMEWVRPIDVPAESSINGLIASSLQTLTIGTPQAPGNFEGVISLMGSAAIKSFTVTGLLKDSTVLTYGNVGTVKLGGIHTSQFLVGTSAYSGSTPIFDAPLTIKNFMITGVAGMEAPDYLFVDSLIAAPTINKISVADVDRDSPTNVGIIAEAIKSYNRYNSVSDKKPAISLRNLNDTQIVDDAGADEQGYRVRIL